MPRPKLPDNVVKAMLRLSDEGMSIRKIAKLLGHSKSCIDWYVYGKGNKSPEALERRWKAKLPAMKAAIREAGK